MSIFTILISMRGKPDNKALHTQLILALTLMPDDTVLNLSEENFGSNHVFIEPEDIINLFKALIDAAKITALMLKINQISIAGIFVLINYIHSNIKLKYLDLEYTRINNTSITIEARIELKNLDRLDISELHFNDPRIKGWGKHSLSEFIRSVEDNILIMPNVSNVSENKYVELHNAYIFHSNRMHQRAYALGVALHQSPLPITIATLIGEYSNLVSTPSLLYAFQYPKNKLIPEELEIKCTTMEEKISKPKSKPKSHACAIL